MTAAARVARALAGATLTVMLLLAAGKARGDGWQAAQLPSPNGKPAQGDAVESTGEPKARLLIGCESADADSWRGIVLWHAVKQAPRAGEASVTATFFGRAPVTERWRMQPDGATGVLLWPPTSETLRRNLFREDATRGHARLTLDVRENDGEPVRLVFALDGLSARDAALAASCGWTATTYVKRRERKW